jgi:hypothetical protein
MSSPAGIDPAELREHPDRHRTGQQPAGESGSEPRTPHKADSKPRRGQREREGEERQRRGRDRKRFGSERVGGRPRECVLVIGAGPAGPLVGERVKSRVELAV